MAKATKPTGVKIARNKNIFTASWTKKNSSYTEKKKKKSASYSSQYYKYRINKPDKKGNWIPVKGNGKKISKSTTSLNFYKNYTGNDFDFKNYHPYKDKVYLNNLGFYVRGDTTHHSVSDAAKASDYVLDVPSTPKVTVSEGTFPSATFSFSVTDNDTGSRVLTRFDVYTKLVKDSTSTIPSDLWKQTPMKYECVNSKGVPNGKFSDSWYTKKEDTSGWGTNPSYTRWVGVIAKGPKGDSDKQTGNFSPDNTVENNKTHYSVNYITYANPNPPVIDPPGEGAVSDKGNGLSVDVKYKVDRTFARPVDTVTTEYLIATPADDDLNPPDSSWTEARTSGPVDKNFVPFTSSFSIDIPNKIGENKCLWVKATSKYSEKQQARGYGLPVLFKKGVLSAPKNVSCGAVDQTSYRATAYATNDSGVPGSFVAVYYVKSSSEEELLGIIPNGASETVIQFSEYIPAPTLKFYNVVGDYKPACSFKLSTDTTVQSGKNYFELIDGQYVLVLNPTGNPSTKGYYEIDGKSIYTISDEKWRSAFSEYEVELKTPTSVTVDYTDIAGTLRVGWDWPWSVANVAEISWADHQDAWESTNEPSKYEISNLKASYWNISGLDTGKKWYIRVRLGIKDGNETIYGPYTKSYEKDLTTIPMPPLLDIPSNKQVILKDEEVTLSWVFISEDGTNQKSSQLYEVVDEDGDKVYKPVASGGPEQYIILNNPNDEKTAMDWDVGELHTYVVAVTSEGEKTSEYSNEVSIRIVEPISCEIVDTSLDNGYLTKLPLTFKVIEGYHLTEDTSVVSGKGYYTRYEDGGYSYEEVDTSGSETINPKESGFYEQSGSSYILTEDTVVDPNKTYYSRSGDPKWVYTLVDNPSEDPKESGYFERRELSSDIGISASILRDEPFDLDRPDESKDQGYDKETIYSGTSTDGTFTVTVNSDDPYNNIVGSLDDRCRYVINAYIKDALGQFYITPDLTFVVNWEHQAGFPDANVEIDNEAAVAFLTPLAPHEFVSYILTSDEEIVAGKRYYTIAEVDEPTVDNIDDYLELNTTTYSYTTDEAIDPEKTYYMPTYVVSPVVEDIGSYYEKDIAASAKNDVCDIYRLSIDRPELIYSGATFEATYVDPYPTIGEYGGHRFVCRTETGDYTTSDGIIAWVDTDADSGDRFDTHANLVDFDGQRAELLYEVDLSSSWEKDFQETRYLGGSIQGDWNPGVSRTATMNVTAVSDYDQELIRTMHRLAAYPGICHVRTKDGASYSADVQVNETYEYTRAPRFNKYDLSITRVDSEVLDGMTLEEWRQDSEEASE